MSKQVNNLGLVLSGGGARAAYQVGVLKGVLKIQQELGQKQSFKVATGVSAGSINAAFWACYAEQIFTGIEHLWQIWANIQPDDVFRTDVFSVGKIGGRLMKDLTLGSLKQKATARSLLDTAPLAGFLKKHLPFENIRKNVERGFLDSVAITASDYSSSVSITFVEGREPVPLWKRSRRRSQPVQLGIEHIMASTAIPIFFPSVKINEQYYGDGSLRNLAPLSPAIHLGADRLFIVGMRRRPPDSEAEKVRPFNPSFGRVLSVLISSIFFDATELDIERLSRINHILEAFPTERSHNIALKPIQIHGIFPSEDIGLMAKYYYPNLPKLVRYLLSGLGSIDEAADLISYLLFEPRFCQALLDLGYGDAMRDRENIERFLS